MKNTAKVQPRKPRARLTCPECGKLAEYVSHSMGGNITGYYCRDNMGGSGCGHHFDVKPTPSEKAYLKLQMKEMNRHSRSIHRTWHAFCRKFGGSPDKKWKLMGYDFMCAVDRWAQKWPEIQVVTVDDNYHTTSYLVLVPHYDKQQKDYWGTTCVYIPQCSGEDPIDFFLYPSHLDGLREGFERMRKFCRKNGIKKGIP